jgi:hypothetical protein
MREIESCQDGRAAGFGSGVVDSVDGINWRVTVGVER